MFERIFIVIIFAIRFVPGLVPSRSNDAKMMMRVENFNSHSVIFDGH